MKKRKAAVKRGTTWADVCKLAMKLPGVVQVGMLERRFEQAWRLQAPKSLVAKWESD